MPNGYAGRILHVDLTTGTLTVENPPESFYRQYLGGSEFSAVFVTERRVPEPEKAAIKLIVADPANSEIQLSRWESAAKLTHPHLLRLFEAGRCNLGNVALLYIVMECADETLAQILPHRPLTPVEAREMLEPTLAALAYIHGRSFVHGRLKPSVTTTCSAPASPTNSTPSTTWCGLPH